MILFTQPTFLDSILSVPFSNNYFSFISNQNWVKSMSILKFWMSTYQWNNFHIEIHYSGKDTEKIIKFLYLSILKVSCLWATFDPNSNLYNIVEAIISL